MDLNWKSEEALMTVRDGVALTPGQEARMRLAEESRRGRDLRRGAASVLVALARRLDPEAASPVWPAERVEGRPA
jgi:hypothetical protein